MVFQAKSKDLAVVCDLAVKIWGGNFEMMEQEFSFQKEGRGKVGKWMPLLQKATAFVGQN